MPAREGPAQILLQLREINRLSNLQPFSEIQGKRQRKFAEAENYDDLTDEVSYKSNGVLSGKGCRLVAGHRPSFDISKEPRWQTAEARIKILKNGIRLAAGTGSNATDSSRLLDFAYATDSEFQGWIDGMFAKCSRLDSVLLLKWKCDVFIYDLQQYLAIDKCKCHEIDNCVFGKPSLHKSNESK